MKRNNRVLITAALPYANGPLHFGHIAGVYLPADCYRRFCHLQGKEVLALCGTDEYGVAITLAARQAGTTPQELIDHYHQVIRLILDKMNIVFDCFSRTTNPYHAPLVQHFFKELYQKGYIDEQEGVQLFCEKSSTFLADRYVEGGCPRCGFAKARGDECPSCGAHFEAIELQNPCSKLDGSPLVQRKTKHLYLHFDQFQEQLMQFLETRGWKKEVMHFISHYIDDLHERCITRDLSWGVSVPLAGFENKVFYVWFDAPIGYLSISQVWAESIGDAEAWKLFWYDPQTQYTQFLGKDNIPFHGIFFPAMVMGQSEPYKLVDDLVASHFYQLEGRQFSKSEGWTIDALDFLQRYDVDSLRYHLAASAPENGDSEFSFREFQQHCNQDLLGKLGNFIHRVLVFIQHTLKGKIPPQHDLEECDHRFSNTIYALFNTIAEMYETYQMRKVTQLIMEMADVANAYFDHKAPWRDAKDPVRHWVMHNTIRQSLGCIRLLATSLMPLMPSVTARVFLSIGVPIPQRWQEGLEPLLEGIELPIPEVLFTKIEDEMIAKEIEHLGKVTTPEPSQPMITYDDFAKLEIRVGMITEASKVEKSKKLLKLSVNIGSEIRTIVSGIGKTYTPEEIIGKKILVVVNLAPIRLMGIESCGMVLAGGEEGILLTAEGFDVGTLIS